MLKCIVMRFLVRKIYFVTDDPVVLCLGQEKLCCQSNEVVLKWDSRVLYAMNCKQIHLRGALVRC